MRSLVVAGREVFIIADDLLPTALRLWWRPALLAILFHRRQRLIQTASAHDGHGQQNVCAWEARVGHVPRVRGIKHLLHLDRVDINPGAFLVVRPRVGEHQPHVIAEGRHGLVQVRVDALAYVREGNGQWDDAVVVWVFALVGELAEEIAPFAAVFVGAVHDRLVTLVKCLFHAFSDGCRQFHGLDFPSFLHNSQEISS